MSGKIGDDVMLEPNKEAPETCDGESFCGDEDCQECCDHDEHDHGVCLNCGHEDDMSGMGDYYKDRQDDR